MVRTLSAQGSAAEPAGEASASPPPRERPDGPSLAAGEAAHTVPSSTVASEDSPHAPPRDDAARQAQLTQLRAQLSEETLSVRRLQQELRSTEDCSRVEMQEMRRRLQVLTDAQRTTRARYTQQGARLADLQAQLLSAQSQLKAQAQQQVELAQRRAVERAAATRVQHQQPPSVPPLPPSPSRGSHGSQSPEACGPEADADAAAMTTLQTALAAIRTSGAEAGSAQCDPQRLEDEHAALAGALAESEQREAAAATSHAALAEARAEAVHLRYTLEEQRGTMANKTAELELLRVALEDERNRTQRVLGDAELRAHDEASQQQQLHVQEAEKLRAALAMATQGDAQRLEGLQRELMRKHREVHRAEESEAQAREHSAAAEAARSALAAELQQACVQHIEEVRAAEQEVANLRDHIRRMEHAPGVQVAALGTELACLEEEFGEENASLRSHVLVLCGQLQEMSAAAVAHPSQRAAAAAMAVERHGAAERSEGPPVRLDEMGSEGLRGPEKQPARSRATGAVGPRHGEENQPAQMAEARAMRLEADKALLQEEVEQERHTSKTLLSQLQQRQDTAVSLDNERKRLAKQVGEVTRQSRREVNRLQERLQQAGAQVEMHVRAAQEQQQLVELARGRQRALKASQEELQRSAQQLVTERGERQQLEARLTHSRGELTVLEERAARHGRELRCKESLLRDMRAKLDAARAAEERAAEERERAEERAKAAGADLARKVRRAERES
jgi:chromosome segregation protein